MKLLFDQNLSPRLVILSSNLYPGSAHVQSLELDTAPDDALWVYARTNGFTIVSKDEDFNNLAIVRGFPPKVLWLQLGNCTTEQVMDALRAHHVEIEMFATDPNGGTFVLR